VQEEALDFVAQGTANGAHRGRALTPPRKVLQHPRGLRRHRREVSVDHFPFLTKFEIKPAIAAETRISLVYSARPGEPRRLFTAIPPTN